MVVVEVCAGGCRLEAILERSERLDGTLSVRADSVHPRRLLHHDAVPVDRDRVGQQHVGHFHDDLKSNQGQCYTRFTHRRLHAQLHADTRAHARTPSHAPTQRTRPRIRLVASFVMTYKAHHATHRAKKFII